jgi:hypothetical protein
MTAREIAASLAEYDAVVAACPANRQHLGEKPCPKCGSERNEGCREENRAAYAFIAAVRAALQEMNDD